MVAQGALWAEVQRHAAVFERRGEPVLHVGPGGRVLAVNAAAELAKGRLFGTLNGRITTVMAGDQSRLDRAVAVTLAAGRPSLVALTVFSGTGQILALAVPVPGSAGEPVTAGSSALVVLIEPGHRASPDERSLGLLREAAELTVRESEVVRLVVSGCTPVQVAGCLGIAAGTVRLHLKAVFAKTRVRSQSELTALVLRLS